jgi:hypothetical protein
VRGVHVRRGHRPAGERARRRHRRAHGSRSTGAPATAVTDAHGIERENYKLVGFVPPDKFRDHVQKLAAL